MDKYVAYLLQGQCFLSFIIENVKGLLAVLDWQLPSSSGGRRWLLWYVGSTWEASGMAWIHQLPQETRHRDPAPPQGGERWVGAAGPLGSLARLLAESLCRGALGSCVPLTLGWDLFFLCYPFAAALKVINTSFESRGFSKHLPSGITYHINHSPRNKLVLT